MTIEEEIRERNDEFHKSLANGDAEAMANHFATNAWFNYSGYPAVHGRDAIAEMFRQSVADGLRGMKSYVISEIIETGPWVIEVGSEVVLNESPDGSLIEVPLNYVGAWQRSESGRLEVLFDLVCPDARTV
ncbi:MAG TPA: nuclear transport factor 2 family protein [Acidimicrobiales bacterium]|nr:nuclear transport factor 2 family protein [Acidimicrobiales bacterium]